MAPAPDFFLLNPVNRSYQVLDRFNSPRTYTFAPTKKQLHEGIDLFSTDAAGRPVTVFAAQRGIVDRVGFAPQGYGNYVRVVHRWNDDTYVTWYGHLSATTAQVGQFVLAGAPLGVAGDTGFSSGIHLHLTLQHIGKGLSGYVVDDVINPEPFFLFTTPPAWREASFVADVTIPDGTEFEPGERFRKIWRVRNTGNTAWPTGTVLIHSADDDMDGPAQVVPQTLPLAPGQLTDVEVELTAPTTPGTQRSTWRFRPPGGQPLDYPVYTEITVQQAPATTDRAAFVADVTIPDGTLIRPGEAFTKTWRIRNSGTSTWTTGYTLRFSEDEQMGGPDRVNFPREVPPGQLLELSVRLTAPAARGTHRSTWRLFNADGTQFPDFRLYAEIQVPDVVLPPDDFSEARYVADVTIPDETRMRPGEQFVKTWRIRNTGTTRWGQGYQLAFFADEQMGGPPAVALPAANPGQTVNVSVSLTAPQQPGLHRSTWKPRDPDGDFFEFPMFALIDVVKTDVPLDVDEMTYVADVTVPDGTVFRPGNQFVKTWRIRNTGTTTWGQGYRLAFAADNQMGGPANVPMPAAAPGDEVEVSVTLTAPQQPGVYKSTWRGRNPSGELFDGFVFALIEVFDPDATFDLLDYLRGDGRIYDVAYDWSGGGFERMQTQQANNRFYHTKNIHWEELWADENFIYRGTDTSPGNGEVYTLYENGNYGSAWIPRRMTKGRFFRRTPTVVFRRKDSGQFVRQFVHVTWIKLEQVYPKVRFPTGVELRDVAVLAAYEDQGGEPKATPFERYLYAKKYGLVAWAGPLGRSFIEREYARGQVPDNQREVISWL